MKALAWLVLYCLVFSAACTTGDPDTIPVVNDEHGQTDGNDDDVNDENGDGDHDPTVPAAPTGVQAQGLPEGASVQWAGDDLADTYFLLRGTSAGGPYTQVYAGTETSHQDTGLTADTMYYYVVEAGNDVGRSERSVQVSVRARYPLAPAPATVDVHVADAELQLFWAEAPHAVSYTVQRRVADGAYAHVADVSTRSWTDTGLDNGTVYSYSVRSVNADEVASDPSATVSATPYRDGRLLCIPSAEKDGVFFFPASGSGDVAPVRALTARRAFTSPTDVVADGVRGLIYLLDAEAGTVLVYNDELEAHPTTSVPIASISGLTAPRAITVDTQAGELYLAETGGIRVYDVTGETPALARQVADASLDDVVDITVAGDMGELFTVGSDNTIYVWTAAGLALSRTITSDDLTAPLQIDFIPATDEIAVLNGAGTRQILLFRRTDAGHVAPVLSETVQPDGRWMAYDPLREDLVVVTESEMTGAYYGYAVTNLSVTRTRNMGSSAPPRVALAADPVRGRLYMTLPGRVTFAPLDLSGGYGSSHIIIPSLNGIDQPTHLDADLPGEEIYIRNATSRATVHSLVEDADDFLLRSNRSWARNIAVGPTRDRIYGAASKYMYWAGSQTEGFVTTGTSNRSHYGHFYGLAINPSAHRLYTLNRYTGGTYSERFESLNAAASSGNFNNGPINTYSVPATTSEATVLTYAPWGTWGEVYAYDPTTGFGWVFDHYLTLEHTFADGLGGGSVAGITADDANFEVFIVRDGIVRVYARDDLNGGHVQPIRTMNIADHVGTDVRDMAICR